MSNSELCVLRVGVKWVHLGTVGREENLDKIFATTIAVQSLPLIRTALMTTLLDIVNVNLSLLGLSFSASLPNVDPTVCMFTVPT